MVANLIAVCGVLATLACAAVAVWAFYRSRADNRVEEIEANVGENSKDIAHIQGFLSADTKNRYQPRRRD